jgi:hypothetical protein
MHLVEELQSWIDAEESLFRAQLLREDMARLGKLAELAQSQESYEGYAKEGLYIGWTQGDFHTQLLKEPIEALMAAVHAYETGGRTDVQDQAVRQAWGVFHRMRLDKLVHCL